MHLIIQILDFLEDDLRYTYIIRQKTKHFPFAPENKIITINDLNDYLKENETKNLYAQ